jgi:uncharacterized protein YuzE
LEIVFAQREIEESEYVDESGIIVDYDKSGNILGIQITSFSMRVPENDFIQNKAV